MWCVRSERVRGEINIRERVKGGPISQVNHRREKRRGEGGAGYWSDSLRYLCLTERRAVEWRRVGEEGVRLLAVGKREVRGALGGGEGRGGTSEGIKGFEESESPMTSSVKWSHGRGCDPGLLVRRRLGARGWVRREIGCPASEWGGGGYITCAQRGLTEIKRAWLCEGVDVQWMCMRKGGHTN